MRKRHALLLLCETIAAVYPRTKTSAPNHQGSEYCIIGMNPFYETLKHLLEHFLNSNRELLSHRVKPENFTLWTRFETPPIHVIFIRPHFYKGSVVSLNKPIPSNPYGKYGLKSPYRRPAFFGNY